MERWRGLSDEERSALEAKAAKKTNWLKRAEKLRDDAQPVLKQAWAAIRKAEVTSAKKAVSSVKVSLKEEVREQEHAKKSLGDKENEDLTEAANIVSETLQQINAAEWKLWNVGVEIAEREKRIQEEEEKREAERREAERIDYSLTFRDNKGNVESVSLGEPDDNGLFKANELYSALSDIEVFLPKVTDKDYMTMGELVELLNFSIGAAYGNDTGDLRGRAPEYYYTLSDNGKGGYTISLKKFNEEIIYAMAARFRAGRQTLFDLSLLHRLQTGYSPYDIGMNPYREFLFLTDPSHSEELTDKMLVTALKKLSKSKGYNPRYENPVLEKYAYDISRVHAASSQGYTRDDLEGYLHGISILQLAGNISTFTRGLRDYFSEYSQNKKLEKRVGNVESGKEGFNNKSSDVRERVLKNLQESQKARESSNFSEYAKREKEFLKQVSEGQEKVKFDSRQLLKSGNQLDKGGELTKVGRALEKHGSRYGSIYPQATGNVANKNALGNQILESILSNPNAISLTRHHALYGDVLEIRIPNGMGVRYSADGANFIGFLE